MLEHQNILLYARLIRH